MRDWTLSSPGCDGFIFENQPISDRPGEAGVSTPCGAVSIRGNSVFVPGLSKLYMYGRISNPRMGTYPPRGALALSATSSQPAIGQ